MSKLQHIVTDIYQVYLTEMEAKIQPKVGKDTSKSSPESSSGAEDNIKKSARQLAYDTRYKARREDIPLERAFTQVLQNSSASSPVKDAAKAMLFGGVKKEEVELEEANKEKVLVTPVKGYGKPYRRYADRKKIHDLRKNPQITSVTPTNYGTPYEGERKKGEQTAAALQPKSKGGKKAKKDYDGDGKVESSSKEHAGVVHNAIQKKKGKTPDGKDTRKDTKEGYSDWRSEINLSNIFEEDGDNRLKNIKKNVDNTKYIKINPELKETVENLGGVLIENVSIDDDYIQESVNYATEYFYNEGLNEEGLDFVIEEVGYEEFFDFVITLGIQDISEARAAKKRKSGKSYEEIKAEIDAREKKKATKKQTTKKTVPAATKDAKKEQPNKKPVRDAIARGVFRAVDAYKKGMERHKTAMNLAKETGKTVAKAASVTHEAGRRAGQSAAGKAIKKAGSAAIKAGVEKAKKDISSLKKKKVEEEVSSPLSKKIKSTERQQVQNAREKIQNVVKNYVKESRRSEREGKGSHEMRTKSGHLVGARGERKRKGEMGGRHFYSGGEGGSKIERGKKKNDAQSQHQRLNPPEKKNRMLSKGTKAATQRAYGYGQGRYQGD